MPPKWQRLHLTSTEKLPPLLFKYTTNPKGYDLHLTDLTHLWTEKASYKTILRRAEEENTTIDPTEDPEQFDVLLEKIGDALHSRPGSRITVKSGNDDDNNNLQLSISTKLPAPLRPLEWSLYLSRENQPAMAEQFLIPLLKEEVEWEAHQRTLLDQIRQKDWVLGKLFDKIESLGIDLSTVFPGMTGLRTARRGTSLEQAAKVIRGVAPFDEQRWLKEIQESSANSGLAANVVSEVSGSAGLLDGLVPAPDKWWENLEVRSVAAPTVDEQREGKGKEQKIKNDTVMEKDDDDLEADEDEFERQETPPKFKQPKEDQDMTERGARSRSDSQSQSPPPTSAPKPPTKKPRSGLGVIGKKKQAPPPPQRTSQSSTESESDSPPPISKKKQTHPPSSPSPPLQEKPKHSIHEETGTESDEDAAQISKPPPKRQSPPLQPPKKSKGLGVIGGKKKEQQKQPTPSPPPPPQPQPQRQPGTETETENEDETAKDHPKPPPRSSSSSSSPPPPSQQQQRQQTLPKRNTKLGTIGGKKQKQTGTTTTTPATTTTTTTAALHPPPPDTDRDKDNKLKRGSTSPPTARTDDDDDNEVKPKPKPKQEQQQEQQQEPEQEQEPPKPKEETEQEKIDKKRDELKRQLEARSKAPVKKKRKF